MDTAIIAHPTTCQASGHLASFSDALIDDKKTGKRFRADKIIEEYIEEYIQTKTQEYLEIALNFWRKFGKYEDGTIHVVRQEKIQDIVDNLFNKGELEKAQELQAILNDNMTAINIGIKFQDRDEKYIAETL